MRPRPSRRPGPTARPQPLHPRQRGRCQRPGAPSPRGIRTRRPHRSSVTPGVPARPPPPRATGARSRRRHLCALDPPETGTSAISARFHARREPRRRLRHPRRRSAGSTRWQISRRDALTRHAPPHRRSASSLGNPGAPPRPLARHGRSSPASPRAGTRVPARAAGHPSNGTAARPAPGPSPGRRRAPRTSTRQQHRRVHRM
jgi:hypothetical protein